MSAGKSTRKVIEQIYLKKKNKTPNPQHFDNHGHDWQQTGKHQGMWCLHQDQEIRALGSRSVD